MTKTKNNQSCKEEQQPEKNHKTINQQDNQQSHQSEIEEILEKTRQECLDYKNHLQRLQAEFENYKRRTAESSICSRNDGICDVIMELIPAIDNLERGIEAVKDQSAKSGMQLILKQLKEALKKFDVCEIEALGERFNPDIHHAVAKDEKESEDSENKVTEVFLKGYQRKTRILRPAMVKVTK